MARRGGDFGVTIDGPIRVDMELVKARKDAIVKQSNDGVTDWLKNMENLKNLNNLKHLKNLKTGKT